MFFISCFIDVDTLYLFLNWFSTRVSDDRKYVCGRRLCACMNTRKFKGIDSRAITSLPDIEKVIYMAHLFNHRRKLFAYSESVQRPTIAILLIQILIFFRPLSSVPLLQSTTKLSSDRVRGPTCFRKALNLIFPKISSQNMRGFHPATILSPSFHGVRKERLTQWPAISDPKTTKMPGGTSRKIGWGCAARFLKPLPYFRPKSVIFPYPISDVIKHLIP